ncbi:unnamed protein product [Spirodela intermedia]|uniref:Uncharacterized protein n=1 Tax=Spirodela intermedia TaxID=51605 RepID=A0A7I8LE06_SPIIN|nr:unnamed protein product [Spirodela intermedia]
MVLSKTASEFDVSVHSSFASRYVRTSLPRFRMPDNSIPKEAAFQIINDELMLDGNPRLNLASFVTTWMEPECDKLIVAAINKSYVDMNITFTMTKRGNLEGFHSPRFLLYIWTQLRGVPSSSCYLFISRSFCRDDKRPRDL